MVISSKGRYALRVMVDLAEHGGDGYVSMRDVARRQEISDKYAGQIMTLLSRAGLVNGVTGKGGGYRLTRKPEEYPLGEILRLPEGSLAPVACLEEGAHPCDRAAPCRTLPVWNRLGQLIGEVQRVNCHATPVVGVNKVDSDLIMPDEILKALQEVDK